MSAHYSTLADARRRPRTANSGPAHNPARQPQERRHAPRAAITTPKGDNPMVAGLLFLIAGLLFSASGVGILIGVPFLLIGFVMLIRAAGQSMGRGGAIAIIIVLCVLWALGHNRAHAGENFPSAMAGEMLALHGCYLKAAGPTNGSLKAVISQNRNPLSYLTDRCMGQAVQFVMACEEYGYPSGRCDLAVIGDAKDVISGAKLAQ